MLSIGTVERNFYYEAPLLLECKTQVSHIYYIAPDYFFPVTVYSFIA
ncbi:MAG: hypothetical protein ACJAWQ_001442 [Paraglaciecola sp.]|jgi:hypothetical protein